MQGIHFHDRDIVILHGARTPFGTFMGAFSQISALDLAVTASKEALKRSQIKAEEIDHVIFGNVLQTSADAAYGARHIGLNTGIPKDVPALTVNRLCGSGFEAIILAAHQILLGRSKIVLAGGTENMTQAPHVVRNVRSGLRLGHAMFDDSLWGALTDSYNNLPMGVTAENLAKKYNITREDSDRYSFQSQRRTKVAMENGDLRQEIVPVTLPGKKGQTIQIKDDEHPRLNTTLADLKKLKPVFDPRGIVTAGSSSGICDGAAAMVLMSKAEAERRGLPYLGRLVSYGVCGVDPDFMGIGPVPASRKALTDAKKTLGDMDLVEINEAFAPQVLAVEKELGIRREKLNVNGGAIPLGHPLGASGARITLTLLMELKRRKKRWGLGAACTGGGQGIAVLLDAKSS